MACINSFDRVEGFVTEGDAGRWIKNESGTWLHSRRRHNVRNG